MQEVVGARKMIRCRAPSRTHAGRPIACPSEQHRATRPYFWRSPRADALGPPTGRCVKRLAPPAQREARARRPGHRDVGEAPPPPKRQKSSSAVDSAAAPAVAAPPDVSLQLPQVARRRARCAPTRPRTRARKLRLPGWGGRGVHRHLGSRSHRGCRPRGGFRASLARGRVCTAPASKACRLRPLQFATVAATPQTRCAISSIASCPFRGAVIRFGLAAIGAQRTELSVGNSRGALSRGADHPRPQSKKETHVSNCMDH